MIAEVTFGELREKLSDMWISSDNGPLNVSVDQETGRGEKMEISFRTFYNWNAHAVFNCSERGVLHKDRAKMNVGDFRHAMNEVAGCDKPDDDVVIELRLHGGKFKMWKKQ